MERLNSMKERSKKISRLLNERDFRSSYLRGKLNVLISSQIYALRKKFFGTQKDLANVADMKQSRISAMEQPGATKFNLETLIRLASTFKVGLIVKFVPYSEMLRWDNRFVQDKFNVIKIDEDVEFLTPSEAPVVESEELGKLYNRFSVRKEMGEQPGGGSPLKDKLKERISEGSKHSLFHESQGSVLAGK